MKPEQQTFIKALEYNEDDTATRMVYSDWLEEHDQPEEADRQRAWPEAKKWLQKYAARIKPYDDSEIAYDELIQGLKAKEIFAHGTDLHGLYELKDADELRKHASIFLGYPLNLEDPDFSFTCSC